MKFLWAFLLLLIIAGGAYFLLGRNTVMHYPTQAPIQQAKSTPTSSPSAMQTITVEGSEFAFNPSSITVKKGQDVEVIFKNMGKYPHNFTISQLNVASSTIQPGEKTTVNFTPTQTGTFTYMCTVPGHADRGMKGTLTVE